MRKEHIAHITTINGKVITQTVKQHCTAVAKYASKSLEAIGLYYTGYLAGLLHDMGKCTTVFDTYIKAAYNKENVRIGTVNHSFAAVIYLLDKHHKEKLPFEQSIAAELIAYACGSHHGTFNIVDTQGNNGFEHRRTKEKKDIHYEETKENFFIEVVSEQELDTLFEKSVKEISTFYGKLISHCKDQNSTYFSLGVLSRVILSAIVDGDRRDAMEFSLGEKTEYKKMTAGDWQEQLAYLDEKIKKFESDSEINRVRKKISDQCVESAERKTGLYKISVPTGAGKTLATLRFSLAHAAMMGKERVIFIIPLLSILDQNSKVIHEYLRDEGLILEHHSDVVCEKESGEDCLNNQELLMETWESPVIVSTLVQLLNTFFSHKNSSSRRFKSLCNSVIVIDEIQSLPTKFTAIFNQVVNFLTENCNTTIVLSSATQPCFDRVSHPMHVSENEDLVVLSPEDRAVFKRVSPENKAVGKGMTLEELGGFTQELLKTKDSVLIVCNTKSEARQLYRILQKSSLENLEAYHLSTSMCKANRREVLEKIGKIPGLNSDKKIVCVSTQLVEAGIDFSFECVVRVEAGIENIIQSAGRCNRNNEWGGICRVYIVRLKNERLGNLEEIKIRQSSFASVSYEFDRNPEKYENDLMSPPVIEAYYTNLFIKSERILKFSIKVGDTEFEIPDMLAHFDKISEDQGKGKYWMRQPFKTAGTHCKVFDDSTTDVIVPYGETGKEVVANLCSQKAESDTAYLMEQIQRAKPYSVSLYEHEMKRLDGMIKGVANDSVYVLNESAYSEEIGVCVDGKYLTDELLCL